VFLQGNVRTTSFGVALHLTVVGAQPPLLMRAPAGVICKHDKLCVHVAAELMTDVVVSAL
jgi:hypothetical protein